MPEAAGHVQVHDVAVTTLENIERRPRVRVPGTMITDACGGELFAFGVVVVTGPAGAGKSTENAHVALKLKKLGWEVVILDAEMAGDLCKEVFERAGASHDDLAAIKRVETREWEAAKARVTAAPRTLVIVDSLDNFAKGREAQRRRIVADCEELAKQCLVFVVAHWAKKGGPKGSTWTGHAVDCVVTVQQTRVWQEKCRWAPPCEVRRRRARHRVRAASSRSPRRGASSPK